MKDLPEIGTDPSQDADFVFVTMNGSDSGLPAPQSTVDSSLSSGSLTSEELTSKVNSLIIENARLRDTLRQNNMSLRQQLETFNTWREEVRRGNFEQSDKFQRLGAILNNQRREIDGLRNQLRGFSTRDGPEMEKLRATEHMNDELLAERARLLSHRSRLEKDIRALQGELAQAKTTLERFKIDNWELKAALSTSEMKRREETCDEESFLIKTLQAQLEGEREQRQHLEKSIEELKCKSFEVTDSPLLGGSIDYIQLRESLHKSKVKLSHMEGSGTSPTKDVMDDFLASVTPLITNCEVLLELTEELEKRVNLPSQSHTYAELQLKMYKERCDQLTAQLLTWEERGHDTEKQCKDLEIIPVLEAQLEIYKQDFEAERAAREKLVGEKDSLMKENDFLRQQIRIVREAHGELGEGEGDTGGGEGSPSQQPCPKCNLPFTNMDALREHVNQCLDTVMWPGS